MNNKALISRFIQKARKRSKLTQHETAKKSSISQAYYAEIESGKKLPSFQVARDISLALNMKGFETGAIINSILHEKIDPIVASSGSSLYIDNFKIIIHQDKEAIKKYYPKNLRDEPK